MNNTKKNSNKMTMAVKNILKNLKNKVLQYDFSSSPLAAKGYKYKLLDVEAEEERYVLIFYNFLLVLIV